MAATENSQRLQQTTINQKAAALAAETTIVATVMTAAVETATAAAVASTAVTAVLALVEPAPTLMRPWQSCGSSGGIHSEAKVILCLKKVATFLESVYL
jgi:hypothetical protein